jgi:cell division protein FtsZ
VETDPLESWARRNSENVFAVVGLGGAGSEAVHDLVRLGVPTVRTFAINTDAAHLVQTEAEERILLGQRQLKGRGSGGDRPAVLAAAEEAREELLRRLRRFEVVFLIAGLGGGTGSVLLPFLVEMLKGTGTVPVPVAFLPFHAETESNPERRDAVHSTLRTLEEKAGLLLLLANEKLRRFQSLALHRVFHLRNTYVHRLVTSLVDLVEHPSQLNVDLATLKAHLNDAGLSTLLVSEHHVSEPERLVSQALTDTLLDFDIDRAPSALVHIDGGSNLSLGTLQCVMDLLRERLGEPRRILYGTRMHDEPCEVVRLTAVVGGLRPKSIHPHARPAASIRPVLSAHR